MESQTAGHVGVKEQELFVRLITSGACVLSCSVVSDSLQPHRLHPRLLGPQ